MAEKRVNIMVCGLVQGVGFRMYVAREASARNLSGWTRNRQNGSVEIEAQGNKGLVDELIRQVQIGPSRARVTSIKVRETAIDAADSGFRILT